MLKYTECIDHRTTNLPFPDDAWSVYNARTFPEPKPKAHTNGYSSQHRKGTQLTTSKEPRIPSKDTQPQRANGKPCDRRDVGNEMKNGRFGVALPPSWQRRDTELSPIRLDDTTRSCLVTKKTPASQYYYSTLTERASDPRSGSYHYHYHGLWGCEMDGTHSSQPGGSNTADTMIGVGGWMDVGDIGQDEGDFEKAYQGGELVLDDGFDDGCTQLCSFDN